LLDKDLWKMALIRLSSISVFLALFIYDAHLLQNYRSYVILFPSDGNEIFLVKNSRNRHWELPGGGAERQDRSSGGHSQHFSTMKREWKEETGIDLPRINNYKKFHLSDKYYYAATTSSRLSRLSRNGRLRGDNEVDRWTLMTVDKALRQRLRGDHYKAIKMARNKGYIGKHGLQI